jgi:hypothetical protein
MKRALTLILMAVCVCAALAQDMAPVPKKEIKAVEFLVGRWTGKETFTGFGSKPQTVSATIVCTKELDGRFLHGMHSSKLGGENMAGLHMLTYDSAKKSYQAWWFDGASSEAMELSGALSGNTLTMTSKPINVPGMEGVIFRATWTKKGAKALNFNLKMQQQGQWMTVIDGNYTRR